jgi:TonB family protein
VVALLGAAFAGSLWLRARERADDVAGVQEQAPEAVPDEELVDFVEIEEKAARQAEAPTRDRPSGARDDAGGRVQPPPDDAYELSAVETPPELRNLEAVRTLLARHYPPMLREAGIEGSVMVRFRIRADGSVDTRSVEVMEATHDLFAASAVQVAGAMYFRPATVSGRPVAVWATLPINFEVPK